jgi:transcriptional regulator with XRE-family HTH domain
MPEANDIQRGTPHGPAAEAEAGAEAGQPVGALLRAARARRGWTLAHVAGRAGMAVSYLSMIENGRVAHPPAARRLRALAEALEIDPQPLLDAAAWEQTPPEVRAQVRQLRDRAEAVQDLARQLRAHEAKGIAPVGMPPGGPIPLINKVAAGLPEEFTDLDYPPGVADQTIPAPGEGLGEAHDPDRFAARVTGDSMRPNYQPGDVVVFSPLADVSPGDDCFVRLEPDHETTFKRVFFDRGDDGAQLIRLQPLNPRFPPRIVPREQVAGMYRAVWRMSPL